MFDLRVVDGATNCDHFDIEKAKLSTQDCKDSEQDCDLNKQSAQGSNPEGAMSQI